MVTLHPLYRIGSVGGTRGPTTLYQQSEMAAYVTAFPRQAAVAAPACIPPRHRGKGVLLHEVSTWALP